MVYKNITSLDVGPCYLSVVFFAVNEYGFCAFSER